jgi:branched-chain amino acid transport system ATP-binding protein
MSFLNVKDLSKNFGGIKAVQGVSFSLEKGELLALIGPNGAGKSTCFNMLFGQLKPDAGSVVLDGENITGLKPRKIWRKGVGRTFQITATYGSMTVIENVQMALISHHHQGFSFTKRATKMYREKAMEMLELVGMAEQAERGTATIAYGDLKSLELAIALAHEPKLLLMDEPAAGMAPTERQALMALTKRIVEEKGVSVLFTEHDMDVVFEHADRILVLNRGQLLANGTVDEIRSNPQVQEVYLGGGTTFANE